MTERTFLKALSHNPCACGKREFADRLALIGELTQKVGEGYEYAIGLTECQVCQHRQKGMVKLTSCPSSFTTIPPANS